MPAERKSKYTTLGGGPASQVVWEGGERKLTPYPTRSDSPRRYGSLLVCP